MSILGRTVTTKAAIALAVLIVLGGMLPAMSGTRAREITLVARGMAFHVEGDPGTANPTLHVQAGERIRIVLRNEERGMTHDFALPAVDAATDLLDWQESDEVTFTAPRRLGTYEYVCRPHLLMMRGLIQVTDAPR